MAGLIYDLVIGGLTALLRRKRKDVYAVIVSFGIWARQNISSLQVIGVCLRYILLLSRYRDFLIVFIVSGLIVAEQINHKVVLLIRLHI